jgi:hypothetical protein
MEDDRNINFWYAIESISERNFCWYNHLKISQIGVLLETSLIEVLKS